MKRVVLILPLITILITSILYFLPVQTIRVTGANILGESDGYKLDIAVGPDLIELTSGFNVTENDSYTYILTAYIYPEYIGSKIRYNITETNNSWEFWEALPFVWINWTADYIFGTFEFYDISQGKWFDGSTQSETTFDEYILAGYNSASPYECLGESFYYCLLPGVDWGYWLSYFDLPVKIPHNFTAVNQSIVENVVDDWTSPMGSPFTNISFTTPTPGNIAGTWSIWTDDDGRLNYRVIYTYNSDGTLTQYVFQNRIKGGKWIDDTRWVLEEEGGDALLLALLSLALVESGGIGTTDTFILAYIAGGFFVFLIIVAVAKSK
ncbi:MAG: hypothetical protein ACFFDN_42730 [Candidatus Hodarchaeota archaeon]